MASKSNHMEYSIWQYIESFGVDSKALHMTSEKRHMEYCIWSLFDAIWSTPCGHYFLPYGVLHIIAIHVNCGRDAKSSIRLVFSALGSTTFGLESPPYGTSLLPYGVLYN